LPEKEEAVEEEGVVVRALVNREVVVGMLVKRAVVVIPALDLPRVAVSRPDRDKPIKRETKDQPPPHQEQPTGRGPIKVGNKLQIDRGPNKIGNRLQMKMSKRARMAERIVLNRARKVPRIELNPGSKPHSLQRTTVVVVITTMAATATAITTTTGMTVKLQL
jgi:hypothetical protein